MSVVNSIEVKPTDWDGTKWRFQMPFDNSGVDQNGYINLTTEKEPGSTLYHVPEGTVKRTVEQIVTEEGNSVAVHENIRPLELVLFCPAALAPLLDIWLEINEVDYMPARIDQEAAPTLGLTQLRVKEWSTVGSSEAREIVVSGPRAFEMVDMKIHLARRSRE